MRSLSKDLQSKILKSDNGLRNVNAVVMNDHNKKTMYVATVASDEKTWSEFRDIPLATT